jgi:hypothetical protein
MNLTQEQIRHYFQSRLQGQRLPYSREISVRCPFHEDRIPSMSINTEKGLWKCFAGCGEGGMVSFEMKLSGCDEATAKGNIRDTLGASGSLFDSTQKPEAIYQYRDANGIIVFEKLRMPGKRFMQRKPAAKGGYEYNLTNIAKPLYNLPEVLTSLEIFIAEGEKDCDNLKASLAGHGVTGVATTTNFDGAGKWKDEYAPYFAGKKVAILPDNDEIGEKHALQVARSVYPYALGVKIVRLPELQEKGDVSDYLKKRPVADLITEIMNAPRWVPERVSAKVLVSAAQFVSTIPEEVDWLIDGLIQRGANGFFCAVPKGAKSWAATDMAISLALGCPWLDFNIPKPVRTGVVSREDAPGLTGWRMRHLLAGKPPSANVNLFEENLYVNTREQTAQFMLDQPEQVSEMVDAMKERGIEFAIFDVFNVLHAADENDNTEMRLILRRLSEIQQKVGCAIGVVHHFNKADTGSMTQRLRGSSAIAGWAEWLIGLTIVDEEQKIRRMEFELKAAQPPNPINFQIASNDANGVVSLTKCDWQMPLSARGSKRAAELMKQ